MTTQATPRQREVDRGQGFGTQLPYEAINEPGCYVCNWSGHLIRVPEDAIKSGHSPLISIMGAEPLFVTRISENPYAPVSKARMLAADCDLAVKF